MLEKLYSLTQRVFTLAGDVAVLKEKMTGLQNAVRDPTVAVKSLTAEFEASKREAAHEREILMLRLENALLERDRELAPPDAPPAIESKKPS